MTNGLGAVFAALSIMSVLSFVALLLAVTGFVGVVVVDERGQVPALLQYVAVAFLAVAVAVSAFGIAALLDEAPPVAALLAVVVVLPLVLAGARTRSNGAPWLAVGAASGMAWSLPFLVGTAILFALTVYTEFSVAVTGAVVAAFVVTGTFAFGEYDGEFVRQPGHEP